MPLDNPSDVQLVKDYVESVIPIFHNFYVPIVHAAIKNYDDLDSALKYAHAQLVEMTGRTRFEAEGPIPDPPLRQSEPVSTIIGQFGSASPPSFLASPVPSSSPAVGTTAKVSTDPWNLPSAPPLLSFQSVDPKQMLLQLDAQSEKLAAQKKLGGPLQELERRVKKVDDVKPTNPAYYSWHINKNNNECVLAAFATANGKIAWDFADEMTSTDAGIKKVAASYGMKQNDPRGLQKALNAGEYAFVRAPALNGNGLHAYCAFGYDKVNQYVYAFDPDNDHKNVKAIPLEFIDLNMIFTR